jgi:alkylation response protein AidB-like acyl-CoA dehydrogenase
MAKLFASEVALEAAIASMKVHGGFGYSTEFEIERLYRDAILMSIGEGTNDILRIVVAKNLLNASSPPALTGPGQATCGTVMKPEGMT